MNDYSDIIFLMGAMIIFALLSMQTSRIFQMNNKIQWEAEIEYNAVSIAQDQIDQVRWISTEQELNNHANSFPKTVPLSIEEDTLFYDVDLDISDISIPESNELNNKKVTVSVANDYLKLNDDYAVQLQFVKSFN